MNALTQDALVFGLLQGSRIRHHCRYRTTMGLTQLPPIARREQSVCGKGFGPAR